jgi:hypothetical protein
VEIRRIGMLGGPAARLVPMTKNASPDATENLTDGITENLLATLTTSEETETEMAASPQRRTASPAAPNLKAAGSATTRTMPTALMPTKINRYVTENGAVTDTAQTATGTAVPNSTKSPNGWTAMTEMSHDEHTLRRISSAGKSE